MMGKRWVAIGLTAVVGSFGLAACGSSDDDNSGSTGSSTSAASSGSSGAKKYDMTLITGVKGDEFYITMGCGAQAEAAKMGVNLNIQGPDKFDASLQTPIVNAVAAKKPDAVLIAPTDSKAMFAPIQQLSSGGAKIVLVDTTLDQPDVAVSAIASDNLAGGTQAAKALQELIGSAGGKVAVVNVKPGISTTDQRAKGFEAGVKGSSLNYVGQQFDDDDPAKAASITKSLLAKNPDLKGIFATNVLTAEGVASGLREAGKKDVKVVTFDAGPKNVEDLKQGLIQGLIAQQPADIGKQGIDQAVAALKGQPTKKDITTGFVTVTKDNIDSPEAQAALYKASC
jgi:ribose transport system substrate-binding protein